MVGRQGITSAAACPGLAPRRRPRQCTRVAALHEEVGTQSRSALVSPNSKSGIFRQRASGWRQRAGRLDVSLLLRYFRAAMLSIDESTRVATLIPLCRRCS